MILFPAIDILNGKCVRLIQGDYAKEKVYSNSPIEIANKWEAMGAKALHIVDLDGAKSGKTSNQMVIETIISNTKVPVQVGGGIRSLKQIEDYLSIGIDRIILGTAAIQDLSLLSQAVNSYKEKIAVSIDARNGLVATEGWRQTSNILALELVKKLEDIGVQTIIYTDISRDGMLLGPNYQELANIQEASSLNLIASGGISSIEDVRKLQEMELYGAIIGKALYDNRIDLTKLLEVTEDVS